MRKELKHEFGKRCISGFQRKNYIFRFPKIEWGYIARTGHKLALQCFLASWGVASGRYRLISHWILTLLAACYRYTLYNLFVHQHVAVRSRSTRANCTSLCINFYEAIIALRGRNDTTPQHNKSTDQLTSHKVSKNSIIKHEIVISDVKTGTELPVCGWILERKPWQQKLSNFSVLHCKRILSEKWANKWRGRSSARWKKNVMWKVLN